MPDIRTFARQCLVMTFAGMASACTTANGIVMEPAPAGTFAPDGLKVQIEPGSGPYIQQPQYRPRPIYNALSAYDAPSENTLRAAGCGYIGRDNRKEAVFKDTLEGVVYECPEQAVQNLLSMPSDGGAYCAPLKASRYGFSSYAIRYVCSRYNNDVFPARPRYRR